MLVSDLLRDARLRNTRHWGRFCLKSPWCSNVCKNSICIKFDWDRLTPVAGSLQCGHLRHSAHFGDLIWIPVSIICVFGVSKLIHICFYCYQYDGAVVT